MNCQWYLLVSNIRQYERDLQNSLAGKPQEIELSLFCPTEMLNKLCNVSERKFPYMIIMVGNILFQRMQGSPFHSSQRLKIC